MIEIVIYWCEIQNRVLEILGCEIPVGLFDDYSDYKYATQQLYAQMMGWA